MKEIHLEEPRRGSRNTRTAIRDDQPNTNQGECRMKSISMAVAIFALAASPASAIDTCKAVTVAKELVFV